MTFTNIECSICVTRVPFHLSFTSLFHRQLSLSEKYQLYMLCSVVCGFAGISVIDLLLPTNTHYYAGSCWLLHIQSFSRMVADGTTLTDSTRSNFCQCTAYKRALYKLPDICRPASHDPCWTVLLMLCLSGYRLTYIRNTKYGTFSNHSVTKTMEKTRIYNCWNIGLLARSHGIFYATWHTWCIFSNTLLYYRVCKKTVSFFILIN